VLVFLTWIVSSWLPKEARPGCRLAVPLDLRLELGDPPGYPVCVDAVTVEFAGLVEDKSLQISPIV
jgi:hypothetical protein